MTDHKSLRVLSMGWHGWSSCDRSFPRVSNAVRRGRRPAPAWHGLRRQRLERRPQRRWVVEGRTRSAECKSTPLATERRGRTGFWGEPRGRDEAAHLPVQSPWTKPMGSGMPGRVLARVAQLVVGGGGIALVASRHRRSPPFRSGPLALRTAAPIPDHLRRCTVVGLWGTSERRRFNGRSAAVSARSS